MSIVKIKNKKALEQLQAKLTLRLGRKPTQQETLDYSVMLANQDFEKLVQLASEVPILNPEKAKRIIEERDKLSGIPYNPLVKFDNPEDNNIYGL